MAGYNGVAWFEIGTDDPAGAEKFYGDIFGWTVRHGDGDPDPAGHHFEVFTMPPGRD